MSLPSFETSIETKGTAMFIGFEFFLFFLVASILVYIVSDYRI